MIKRTLYEKITGQLFKGKAIIILGARQVGKTTILEELQKNIDGKFLFLTADEPDVRERLTNVTSSQLKQVIGDNRIVVIDEAQRIKNIGLTLKLITDQIKHVQLVATGSSAFELANEINEPLTGRKYEYSLFPISVKEMIDHHGAMEEKRMLETRLIYGMYPEVVINPGKEKRALENLTGSYLYKDIFSFQEIRRPNVVEKLLQALALQVCNEISYNELAQIISADPVTVERYIGLLEQAFVIFRLYSLSRNHRNELKKSRKVYFYDNGIRNALIANFNPLSLRQDTGALWENFMVSERIKHTHYNDIYCNRFFWRTLQQQEIDYIEEREGKLFAFEFKWNKKVKPKFPKTFASAYPNAEMKMVTPDNYEEFIT
ncbi:MAG: ATP-binding protein [Bacteroidetes bacterium]|nr:ATP-binding protein [Bacteroidota bacterium]